MNAGASTSQPAVNARDESAPERKARAFGPRRLGPRFAIALGGLAISAGLFALAGSLRARPPLPIYGHVPVMHLVDQRGAPFDDAAMLGHVSVVDFIFTRCASSCPRLTATMGELQGRLERAANPAKLVSFSVDPDNDTPAVLTAYAARAHADSARWSFVTGPPDDVIRAVVAGFKISATKIANGAHDYDVTHGDWFVLVDSLGQLRGYYATDDSGALQTLVDDIRRLRP